MLDNLTYPDLMNLLLYIPFLVFLGPRSVRWVASKCVEYRFQKDKSPLEEQIREYRKELSKISQTEEFAKYSKIQRKLRSTSDQHSNVKQQEFELSLKLSLLLQAMVWLVALFYSLRLLYLIYYQAKGYLVGV